MLEARAFRASAPDRDDLAVIDTLHGLPANARPAHSLIYGEISFGRLFARMGGEANARAPGASWSPANDAVESAMNR